MRRRYLPFLVIALLSVVLLAARTELGGRAGFGSRAEILAPVVPPGMTPIAGATLPTRFKERVEVTLILGAIAGGPAGGLAPPSLGHLILEVESGVVVARHDGRDVELSPGNTLTVAAGESLSISNPSETPAMLVMLYLDPIPTGGTVGEPDRAHMSASTPGFPAGSSYKVVVATRTNAFPFDEADIRVDRLVLTAGGVGPALEATERVWIGIGRGTLGLTLNGPRLPLGWKPGDEQKLAAERVLPIIPPETELSIRNAGADELVLYQVTISMSERWSA